ncbi:MAG: hypothetical protein AAGA00_06595 [Pseudomonadota bacterium]
MLNGLVPVICCATNEQQQWAKDIRHSRAQMPFDARFLNNTPHMMVMNRRSFIQSLVAVFSLPAGPTVSLRAAPTALPAAAVSAQARSWAVYMSTLHGECTPRALQSMLNIPETDAKRYLSRLIADGVLKPNPLLQTSVSNVVKTIENSPLDKIKRRLEIKAQAEPEQLENRDSADAVESLDNRAEMSEAPAEVDPAGLAEDDSAEDQTQASEEGAAAHDRLARAAAPRD